MKKRALLAATAMLIASFNPLLVTPALANPPIQDTTGLTPQEICDNQLKPDYNSDFQTEPQNVSVGDWVTVGDPVLGDPIGDPYGVGTPTPSDNVFDGTYIRHGGSPNVWGGASSTLTYPQTGQLYETTLNQERTTTFDCFVWKIVGHDTLVDPAGLQSTGNTSVEEQAIAGPNQEVITDDDFIVYGEATDVLICISPNNVTKGKPGTWTRMHGFTGSCTDASNIAGTTFIPSHNNPTTDAGINH
jgi:hypothetical protein